MVISPFVSEFTSEPISHILQGGHRAFLSFLGVGQLHGNEGDEKYLNQVRTLYRLVSHLSSINIRQVDTILVPLLEAIQNPEYSKGFGVWRLLGYFQSLLLNQAPVGRNGQEDLGESVQAYYYFAQNMVA